VVRARLPEGPTEGAQAGETCHPAYSIGHAHSDPPSGKACRYPGGNGCHRTKRSKSDRTFFFLRGASAKPAAVRLDEEEQPIVTKEDREVARWALAERMKRKHPKRPPARWFDRGDIEMVAKCTATIEGDRSAKGAGAAGGHRRRVLRLEGRTAHCALYLGKARAFPRPRRARPEEVAHRSGARCAAAPTGEREGRARPTLMAKPHEHSRGTRATQPAKPRGACENARRIRRGRRGSGTPVPQSPHGAC